VAHAAHWRWRLALSRRTDLCHAGALGSPGGAGQMDQGYPQSSDAPIILPPGCPMDGCAVALLPQVVEKKKWEDIDWRRHGVFCSFGLFYLVRAAWGRGRA
jgi:hypothetical protein